MTARPTWITSISLASALLLCSPAPPALADQVGINLLQDQVVTALDSVTNGYRDRFDFALVGVVYAGEVVLTKSYVIDDVNRTSEWASISKPATTMIVMQLLAKGLITSLDDNIWDYAPKYIGCMPAPYTQSPLTIRHLLTHQGGLRYAAPLWDGDRLDLQFEPGTQTTYSTAAWGIVGDVIRAASGQGFRALVEDYLGKPVNAPSITAREQDDAAAEVTYSDWQSPASYISSTIEDMARFSAGVMNHVYVTAPVLSNEVLVDHGGGKGLGWMLFTDPSSGKLYASHTGDNGDQKSVMANDVSSKMSVSILINQGAGQSLNDARWPWVTALIETMDSFPNPLKQCEGDGDGDRYGAGATCLGPDCNDADPAVHQELSCSFDGARCGAVTSCVLQCPEPPAEICGNGLDDDCDGLQDCDDESCAASAGCSVGRLDGGSPDGTVAAGDTGSGLSPRPVAPGEGCACNVARGSVGPWGSIFLLLVLGAVHLCRRRRDGRMSTSVERSGRACETW